MITYLKDADIFEQTAQAYVNPVNCIGVMGAGLAEQFADRTNRLLEQYKAECKIGMYQPGTVIPFLHIREMYDHRDVAKKPEPTTDKAEAEKRLAQFNKDYPPMHPYDKGGFYDYPIYVFNFATMDRPGERADIKNIRKGLRSLAKQVEQLKIRSIAIPALGAGIGRLPWSEVKHQIELAFKKLTHVDVYVFEPH